MDEHDTIRKDRNNENNLQLHRLSQDLEKTKIKSEFIIKHFLIHGNCTDITIKSQSMFFFSFYIQSFFFCLSIHRLIRGWGIIESIKRK